MRIISVQFRLAKNPYKPPEKAVFFGFPFLRPEPRDGYAFSRGVESNRSSERISFQSVRGRCGAFIPLGWVAENLEGSERGRDAMRPSPQIGGKRLAAEFRGMEGGLYRNGETILLECFSYGAFDVSVLISLRTIDEGRG